MKHEHYFLVVRTQPLFPGYPSSKSTSLLPSMAFSSAMNLPAFSFFSPKSLTLLFLKLCLFVCICFLSSEIRHLPVSSLGFLRTRTQLDLYPYNSFSSVQSLSRVLLFATSWTPAHQASVSITNLQSLLKFMSTE